MRQNCKRDAHGLASMLALVSVAACAPHAAEPGPQSAVDGATASPAPADIRSILDAATRDAASRLDVDPAAVEVASAVPVTWPDGSLGCPADGMMYTQALVPGYRVILRAGGQVLDYHAAANGHFVLCPPERAQEPLPDSPV